jgi:hypothetical protein
MSVDRGSRQWGSPAARRCPKKAPWRATRSCSAVLCAELLGGAVRGCCALLATHHLTLPCAGAAEPPERAMSSVDALSSEEMRFGARLAHTEKSVRDKTVANLSAFLASREEMSELELLKIWKGLFYCMWMADKTPVQNELSENLARLVHDFRGDLGLHFVRTFLITMEREWGGIDVLRMDKFYYLVRRVVHELFVYAQRREWAPDTVQAAAALLANGPMRIPASSAAPASRADERQAALAPTQSGKGKTKKKKVKTEFSRTMADTRDPNINWVPAPRGLCYHIIDVVWKELRAVCGDVVPATAYPIMDVLVLLCAFSPDRVTPTRVADRLLEPLVDPELAEGETVPFAVRNPHIVTMVSINTWSDALAR